MITKDTYTIEYVNALREKYKKDPSLLERVLFAFGLYLKANMGNSQYKKLSYMRTQNLEAFAYIVESLRLIGE